MDDKRKMLQHFLAALAYRTQKALRSAPPEFASFQGPHNIRTPHELITHMDSVLGYARTFFIGGTYTPPRLPFEAAIVHFHEILKDLSRHLEIGTEFHNITPEVMLQGPFSDAMTHAGQLAMLRRIAGNPVASENFIFAHISPEHLGPDQALPARPDLDWEEKL